MTYKGVVQKGRGYGQALGFPTINIPLEGEPVSGIYAAVVHIDGTEYKAASYADLSRNIIEAHLFDFSSDLYGKEVEIELIKKIREDEQFADELSLQTAIAADIAKIREYFAA